MRAGEPLFPPAPVLGVSSAVEKMGEIAHEQWRENMKRTLTAFSALVISLGAVTPVLAADSVGTRIALKATRGVENTTLGFVTEVPKTIYYDSVDHGIPYGTTVGAVRGVAMGVVRTLAGVYEVATFPVPVPPGYKAVLHPEYPHDVSARTTD